MKTKKETAKAEVSSDCLRNPRNNAPFEAQQDKGKDTLPAADIPKILRGRKRLRAKYRKVPNFCLKHIGENSCCACGSSEIHYQKGDGFDLHSLCKIHYTEWKEIKKEATKRK